MKMSKTCTFPSFFHFHETSHKADVAERINPERSQNHSQQIHIKWAYQKRKSTHKMGQEYLFPL
jgi:hypothetical protein